MPFSDLLQWVSQSRKTGTLSIEGQPHNKKIYFRDGLVAAASSENPKEFLGYYLVGWNYIGEDELEELLDMQEQYGTLLGELLVIIGRLNREDLQQVLQVKTEESIYELFLWQEGDFRFLENILPAKKFQPLNLPVEMIILEGVRRKDEWARCREMIPDESWIPSLVRAVDVEQLGEIELNILREIDGKNSIERIALANQLAFFHVLMFVFQGMSHDLFEVRPPEDEITAIPGFSKGTWMTMIHQVEEMMGEGDLFAAHNRLAEIRDIGENRLGEAGNIRRVVRSVGIHQHNHRFGHQFETRTDSRALSCSGIEVNLGACQSRELGRRISRVPIHHDHPPTESERPAHGITDGALLVLGEDHGHHVLKLWVSHEPGLPTG